MPRAAELTTATLGEICLHHLAEDLQELARFMGETGYSPDALRRSAGSQALARGLIDYFATNEPLLMALCANRHLRPEEFMRVWHKLNPSG